MATPTLLLTALSPIVDQTEVTAHRQLSRWCSLFPLVPARTVGVVDLAAEYDHFLF